MTQTKLERARRHAGTANATAGNDVANSTVRVGGVLIYLLDADFPQKSENGAYKRATTHRR